MDLISDYEERIQLPGELKRRPWQRSGVIEVERILEDDPSASVCMALGTGGGKTLMISDLAGNALTLGHGAGILTNRKIIAGQIVKTFEGQGYDVSLMMAERERLYDPDKAIQVAMLDTMWHRCIKNERWSLPRISRLLIDESHLQKADKTQSIIAKYKERGVAIIGFSATPVGVSHIYDHLVQPAVNSELRRYGALVPADYYCATEFDTKKLKRSQYSGEFVNSPTGATLKKMEDMTELERMRAMRSYTRGFFKQKAIVGRVVEDWLRFNPERYPGLSVAPGVPESVYLYERFNAAGIAAAQISSDGILVDGRKMPATDDNREELFKRTKPGGDIEVLCSAFILREGFDAPWLRMLQLATPIGSFKSYIQTIGRILRAAPGKKRATIIDHGGNWWRHPPPQRDIYWRDYFYSRENFASEFHYAQVREGAERQPIVCGKCGTIRLYGDTCHSCGWFSTASSRVLIEAEGNLRKVDGQAVRRIWRSSKIDTEKLWKAAYLRCKRKSPNFSFRQVEGLFVRENGYYPTRDLPFMPKNPWHWFQPISSVDIKDLH